MMGIIFIVDNKEVTATFLLCLIETSNVVGDMPQLGVI